MPEISRFFGIIVYIFYKEHQPPHFHAIYGEYDVIIAIDSLSIIAGNLPPRALGLVIEWATLHQKELKEDWQLATHHQKLKKIKPLK